jgi:two-component system, NtrC family, nitrogen regulation sensor histidine kinase NtrY
MAATSVLRSRLLSSPLELLRALSRPSLIAVFVALAAVVSGIVTYFNLTGRVPYDPTSSGLIVLLLVDLTLGLTLAALIAWRIARLWTERKSGAVGSRLHFRLVAIFSSIAVVPAILVAIFAAFSLNLGIEAWFSERVQTALANSVSVASAYVDEHRQVIRNDIRAMQFDLNSAAPLLQTDQQRWRDLLQTEAQIRALPAVYVMDSMGNILASARREDTPDRGPVAPEYFQQAASGEIVTITEPNEVAVTALVKLDAFVDAYLLVSRSVDPQVLERQQGTLDAVSEYERLNQNRSQMQLSFAGLYVVVAMLILLGAVWTGLWAANKIVMPIGRLATASGRVSEGDLSVRVDVARDGDEINSLGKAFNRMTSQLEGQRNALVEANTQLDSRRRFTEAVLNGVSSGVVGLDGDGHVTLINPTASRLLGAKSNAAEGTHYSKVLPELGDLVRRAMVEHYGNTAGQVEVRRDGALRHLNVQVSREAGDRSHGFVVTFDDITDLVSAQRTAAWAEVARRIAHEIKNPLTPIQLSAERLKRKYGDEISSDPEVFAQCTDTIIRQVGDIGRMVDEFSSFARMPAPVIRPEEVQELARHAVFLQRIAYPQIHFEIEAPQEPIVFECDGRLISQALTNLLKNASESVASRETEADDGQGRVVLTLAASAKQLTLAVEDNGVGLPPEHRHRLTEPYVTTRAKGTGLGLAIVRKVVEDHGGELQLADVRDEKGGNAPGAIVRMIFPLVQENSKKVDKVSHEQERVSDHV